MDSWYKVLCFCRCIDMYELMIRANCLDAVVYNLVQGDIGEDGTWHAFCDRIGAVFVGSEEAITQTCIDKVDQSPILTQHLYSTQEEAHAVQIIDLGSAAKSVLIYLPIICLYACRWKFHQTFFVYGRNCKSHSTILNANCVETEPSYSSIISHVQSIISFFLFLRGDFWLKNWFQMRLSAVLLEMESDVIDTPPRSPLTKDLLIGHLLSEQGSDEFENLFRKLYNELGESLICKGFSVLIEVTWHSECIFYKVKTGIEKVKRKKTWQWIRMPVSGRMDLQILDNFGLCTTSFCSAFLKLPGKEVVIAFVISVEESAVKIEMANLIQDNLLNFLSIFVHFLDGSKKYLGLFLYELWCYVILECLQWTFYKNISCISWKWPHLIILKISKAFWSKFSKLKSVGVRNENSLCIRPANEHGNIGAAKIDSPEDLAVYAEALHGRIEEIPSQTLSWGNPSIPMPPQPPSNFVVEPYSEPDKYDHPSLSILSWDFQLVEAKGIFNIGHLKHVPDTYFVLCNAILQALEVYHAEYLSFLDCSSWQMHSDLHERSI